MTPARDMSAPASMDELCEVVREAADRGASLRIAGNGTWLDAGAPTATDAVVATTAMRGVIEYVPGDLVITVHAGTTLAELSAVTAEHAQWLALDPFVSADGLAQATIGATVATASHGPLALGYGRPRDLVLGLGAVCGDGRVLRVGGRVVKNVAGFDLVRLLTGAWGTLGVIGEVSLRLHARPSRDETFAVVIPQAAASGESLAALVERLNSAPLTAATLSLASLVLLSGDVLRDDSLLPAPDTAAAVLVARAVGNAARVNALRRKLAELGDVIPLSVSTWDGLRTFERGNTTLRLPTGVRRIAATWRVLHEWRQQTGAEGLRMLVDPMRGTFHVNTDLASDQVTEADAGERLAWPAGAIAERLPTRCWSSLPAMADDPLSSGIRQRFDPRGVLNPGILGQASPVSARATT